MNGCEACLLYGLIMKFLWDCCRGLATTFARVPFFVHETKQTLANFRWAGFRDVTMDRRVGKVKKGQIYEGYVESVEFPNKGIVYTDEGERVIVKNAVPGQRVSFQINKIRHQHPEGRLLQTVLPAVNQETDVCNHAGICGGCNYQCLSYKAQLEIKRNQVKKLLDEAIEDAYEFEGICGSPRQYGYRNKMEFSFGDAQKDGPLELGMHRRNSMYDIETVTDCRIVDEDYRMILRIVLEYFRVRKVSFYHKMTHMGVLRHLLVRKATKTGEILIALVTTSQEVLQLQELVEQLKETEYQGHLVGILHIVNDSVADVVQSDETRILYGRDFITEELLGLHFQIGVFSFFQTNSLGAEVLYQKVREYIGDTANKNVFDLYSGTGTIAQIVAPVASRVTGVEIVEEAVEAARVNAKMNGLDNCYFLAGDVLKMLDEVEEKPDLIVLDPPRDGIHPKALEKIIAYGVERMVYVSCKPTSLVRDLEVLQERGYRVEKVSCVDMFPGTVHVETVCKLVLRKPVTHVNIDVNEEELV